MAKYLKNQEMVDAVQWSKTGDHEKIKTFSDKISTEKGKEICNACSSAMSNHGCRELDGGHYDVVCPGRWIITHEDGCIEYLDDATFQARYSLLKE